MVYELNILIVERHDPSEKAYEFFVCKSCVLMTIEDKLNHDPYYKDAQLSTFSIYALPNQPIDISSLLLNATTSSFEHHQTIVDSTYDLDVVLTPLDIQPSSFIPFLPNSCTELGHICAYLHSTNPNSTSSIDWPRISLSPISEYKIEGLFAMEFPTLFPTCIAMITQPRITKVEMHEYYLYLLHYHDN